MACSSTFINCFAIYLQKAHYKSRYDFLKINFSHITSHKVMFFLIFFPFPSIFGYFIENLSLKGVFMPSAQPQQNIRAKFQSNEGLLEKLSVTTKQKRRKRT